MVAPTLALNLLSDILQQLPSNVQNGTSFFLGLLLLLTLVVCILGIITALLDVALYAAVATLAIIGLFLITDMLAVDAAIHVAQNLLDSIGLW